MAGINQLVPFTGYYSMSIAPGAFLSIDTTDVPSSTQPIFPVPTSPTITVSVSMDGKTSSTYPFTGSASFDGSTLHIPDGKIKLQLTRNYDDGRLVSFTGTIDSKTVNGSTYYNPVPLSAFVGDYFDADTGKQALSIKSDSSIMFDFSIFSGGGKLQQVESHTYTPAMFVLAFTGSDGTKFILMLGTAGKSGLACSIQGGGIPRFAVSILPLSP